MTDGLRRTQSHGVKIVARVEPMSEALGSLSSEAAAEEPAGGASSEAVTDVDFRATYDAEFGYVWHSLRRLGVYDRDLEDLAHDVFVAFYRGLDTFERGRPIKPWLFGIAFRVASDYRRRARHRFEVVAAGEATRNEFADAEPLADERLEHGERRQLVLDALATLDLDRRAVFVMHDLDGHPMPEIARALGVPLNTCYSRLRLGREQFATTARRLKQKRMPETQSPPAGPAMKVER